MANGLAQALATLAQSFGISVTPTVAATSREFTAKLIPPALDPRGRLLIDDVETTTQLVQSAIDLGWLTKDVRFVDPDITHLNTVGGMPINDLLTLNVGSVTTGATNPPGVPGVLGAINGTVQIPMDVTQTTQLPVQIDARWTIKDDQGNVLVNDDLSWTIMGIPGTGGMIPVAAGNALQDVLLAFSLVFVEQINGVPVVKRRTQASVQLRAGAASSGWIDLPSLDVPIPVIPVPTILFLLENTLQTDSSGVLANSNQSPGKALVMVPANSPLDQNTFQQALTNLSNLISPFQTTLTFLGLIFGELGTIATILNSAKVTFHKGDGISNLDDIVWDPGWIDDDEPEDEISSLVMIAVRRRQAQCFNGRNFNCAAEGEMSVTCGPELLVEVPNLHNANPTSNPSGRVSVPCPPTGWRWFHYISQFGDEFSSIRFAWE